MLRAAGRRVRALAAAVLAVLLAAVLAGALSGCGASPTPLGPTGVDGLTIPTPSPDPADFGDRVDNPWFPLAPGTVWTYSQYTATHTGRVLATVLPHPRRIAGVSTTGVRWETRQHGRRVVIVEEWYAEDLAGNVWWFGQDVRRPGLLVDQLARRSWRAGEDGAQAGLWIAAEPRVGDGYYNALAPGVVERRSTVVSVTAAVATPRRTYRPTLLTSDASSLQPTLVTQSFFARGIGLVAQQATNATTADLALIGVRRP